MENNTPRTLQDCFAIIDGTLSVVDKNIIMETHEFELKYAFHSGLAQWIDRHIVQRYGLRGQDFFIATDLWHEILLTDNPPTFSTQILVEYRKHLLRSLKH